MALGIFCHYSPRFQRIIVKYMNSSLIIVQLEIDNTQVPFLFLSRRRGSRVRNLLRCARNFEILYIFLKFEMEFRSFP